MSVTSGTPWFFQQRGTTEIVGGAVFVAYSIIPLKTAWDYFGEANGAASLTEFVHLIGARREHGATPMTEIGCATLTAPVFFDRGVANKRLYGPIDGGDTNLPEDAELWNSLSAAMASSLSGDIGSPLSVPAGIGTPTLVYPRLGQTGFRASVLAAYDRRCAVTGERTIPVLEAAHIKPFSETRQHDVRNGLLLRSDLHALFDAGLVTVRPNLRFAVSKQIRERYANGREYYALDEREIRVPSDTTQAPLTDFLDYHSSEIFQP